MKQIKDENQRLTREDVIYMTWFVDEETEIKVINPTNFKLRFFTHGCKGVVCSRDGVGVPQNCEIDSEGNVFCFLPKNTFLPGCLFIESMDTVDCDGFDDGDFETIEPYKTKVTYIDLE